MHSSPVAANECILSVIGMKPHLLNRASDIPGESNQFNYCVATQDESLRDKLRAIPGVPLIYINKSVTILEPPSPATLNKVNEKEIQKMMPREFEKSVLKPKEEEKETSGVIRPKKRKAKGPNPLSCRKKKSKVDPAT